MDGRTGGNYTAPSKTRKWLLEICGLAAVGLGVFGIFLPLLPTTPFLLLAAACFFRSSDRLYNWLIHHRWFGRTIRQYREHKAVSLQTKLATLLLLWITLAISGMVIDVLWLRLVLLLVGIGVTWHVSSMKTMK